MMAIMAVAALTANAQYEAKTFSLEANGSVGYSTLSNMGDFNGGLSEEFGLDAIYQANDWFGVSVGASYFLMQSDEVNSIKKKFQYLNVPILARFSLSERFSAFTGVKVGFLTSAKNGDVDAKDYCNSTHFTLPVGLRYAFNSGWSLAAQYNFSLNRLNKDDLVGGAKKDDVHLSPIMLTLAYRFSL